MINEIVDFITRVGFPIAMCVVMGVEMRNMRQEFTQLLSTIVINHKAETDKLSEALNNNTLAIQKLTDYISSDV